MPSILFVCTGNRCRSPLAAAIFTRCLQEKGRTQAWQVESAGTWARSGLGADPLTQAAGEQIGLDISQHRTRSVEEVSLGDYDLIVVMEGGHKEALGVEFPEIASRIHLLTHLAGEIEDVPDPSGQEASFHRDVANELVGLIGPAFGPICDLAGSTASGAAI